MRSYEIARDARSRSICVPATINKIKANVDDGVIVQQFTTKNPIPAMKTSEMRANMSDFLAAVVVGKMYPIPRDRPLLVQPQCQHFPDTNYWLTENKLTLRSVEMEESTAVAHVFAKIASTPGKSWAYLMRYSK